RIATAISKYWICRRAPTVVNEAQESLGGAGYVEVSLLPRLYRQAPQNTIWGGSGYIQRLDVLRALSREPETGEALRAEIEATRGLHPAFDTAARSLGDLLAGASEAGARRLAERLALALQASALLRAGSPVAEAFCRTRL